MLIPLSDSPVGPVLNKGEEDLLLTIDPRVPVVTLIKALTAVGLVIARPSTHQTAWGIHLLVMNRSDWEQEKSASLAIAQLPSGFGPP